MLLLGQETNSFWIGAAALWTFSAAVSAMAAPAATDGKFYLWLYKFTHLLAANLDKFFGSKLL